MSIKTKLYLITLLACLSLAGYLSLIYWDQREISNQSGRLISHQFPALEQADQIGLSLRLIAENFEIAATAGEEDMLQSAANYKTRIDNNFANLTNLFPSGDLHQRTLQLQELFNAYYAAAYALASKMMEGAEISALGSEIVFMKEQMNGFQHKLKKFRLAAYDEFTGSIKGVNSRIESILFWGLIIGATIMVFLFVLNTWISNGIINRILSLSRVMGQVSSGDYSHRVPLLGKDELNTMAWHFNQMVDQVETSYATINDERSKLQTIIQSTNEAIIVTDKSERIILVNDAAETILAKSKAQIISGGFRNITHDPELVAQLLDPTNGVHARTQMYDERILNIRASTIYNEKNEIMGSGALIRDITEEKKLEGQLRELSYTDKLTKLFNRRRLEELLQEEFARASRYGHQLSLLFFDVDHFKQFNDNYGHDQGDAVLASLGGLAQLDFRNIDHACRYGGEEFCVIMPSTSEQGAAMAAERFRKRVERMPRDNTKITISIGVATFPKVGSASPQALIKAADTAMYEAKQAGRNQVKVAS